jgi:hypothetical protein
MKEEDDHPLRRHEDLVTYRELLAREERAHEIKKIAIGLLAVLCIVAVGAAGALTLALIQDSQSRHRSDVARDKANAAVKKASKALAAQVAIDARINATVLGICNALNSERDNTNETHGVLYGLFVKVARLEERSGRRLLRRATTETARRLGEATLAFSVEVENAAMHLHYAPRLDCVELAAKPLTYSLPRSLSFGTNGAPG